MTKRFMFSGADPAPIEDLYSDATVAVRAGDPKETRGGGFVTRTVAKVALVAVIACTPATAELGIQLPHLRLEVGLGFDDDDPLVEAVRTVTSDGEVPSEAARAVAELALDRFRALGLEPDRAVADPEGGVALYVFGTEVLPGGARAMYGRLAAMNDGSIVAVFVDRRRDHHEGWMVEKRALDGTVKRLRGFLEA